MTIYFGCFDLKSFLLAWLVVCVSSVAITLALVVLVALLRPTVEEQSGLDDLDHVLSKQTGREAAVRSEMKLLASKLDRANSAWWLAVPWFALIVIAAFAESCGA